MGAWRNAPGAIVVTESSALWLLELGADVRGSLLCLLASEAELDGAFAGGATECELDPDAARLALRLRAMQAKQRQLAELRADASVLEMMTASPETGWRFWEFDLRSRRFTRALPTTSSSRYLSLEELERVSWQALYPVASRDIVRNAIRDAIEEHRATGEVRSRTVEVEIINADGSTGFRRTRLSLALDDGGAPTLVRGITWDVTDFVAARESLSSIEASLTGLQVDYRRLFDSVHDAIVVFDPVAGTILDVNVRACEMYDQSRSELLGAGLDCISPHPERERDELRRALEGEASLRFDTVQLRKDGSEMMLDVNASRIEYAGKPAVLSISRDVTERHAHERELRKRDKALADASRLEAVGRLAGGVAHDFNNLLMVIESCSEAIAAHDSSDRLSEETADLQGAVARAKGLVRQLLVFARQAPVLVQTFDALEVLRPLASILRRLVSEDIEIVTSFERSLPSFVRMDPSQLEQIVVNLVVNARDSISGAGTISVDLVRSERPGFCELVVRDDGCGMDEATRSRALEPFFTTKDAGKGTGLGLATVHGIVAVAKGDISIASQPNVGTEIRVRLPTSDAMPTSIATARGRRASQPGSESILLVEDERAVRRILARELTRSGYRVFESENGVEALALAASLPHAIDLLVTDVVMPRMGGEELARRLRTTQPSLKVLFMSGYADRRATDEVRADELGTLMSKPFPPALLMERVRELFMAS